MDYGFEVKGASTLMGQLSVTSYEFSARRGQTAHSGDRTVRLELWRIILGSGLPHQGKLFDHA